MRGALDGEVFLVPGPALIVAKERLADPSESISETAYYLGYQYPQYFSRAFKKAVGCTPLDYCRRVCR